MDLSGFSDAERALIMGMSTFADEGAAPAAGPSEPKPKKRSSSSAKRALKPVVPTPTPDIEPEPPTSRKGKGKKRAGSEPADAETADQKHAAKLLRRARKKARRKAEEERLAAEAETMAQLDREAAAASKKRRKSEPSHQPPPPDEPVVKVKKRKSEPAPPPPREDPSPAPAPTSKKRKREAERESLDNEASAEPPRERNKKRQKVDVVEDATPAPEVQQVAEQRRGSGRKSATLAREALSQQYALSATDPAHDRRSSSSPRASPRISEDGAASSADEYGVATPPPPVIKRKVGRPRKHPLPSPSPVAPQSDDDGEDADEPVVAAPAVTKRGPGRPPKRAPTTPAVVASDDDDDDEAAVEAAPVVKRGPGRPRKHPLPPVVAVPSDGEREDDAEDAPPLVQRKVGRPRKIPAAPVEDSSEAESEAAPVVEKRKRGRPPKLVRVPKPPTAPADDEREDDRVPPPAVAAPAKRPVGRPRKTQAPAEEPSEVDESTDEAAIAASMVPRKDPSPAPAPVAAVAPAELHHPNRIPEASWPHLFYQQPLGARPRVLLAEDAWPRQGAFVPLTEMPGFVGLDYIAQAFDRAHASFTDGVIAETRRRLGVQDAAPVQAEPDAAPMDVDEPVQDEPVAVAAESPRAPSPFLPPAEQRVAPATSTDDDETESEDDADVDRKPVIASPSPVVRRTPGPPIELHGSSSEDESEPEAKQTTALKSVSPAPAPSVEPSPATLVAPTLRTFVAPPPAAAPEMNLSDSQLASHIVKQADAGLEESMSLRVPARPTRRSPVPSSSQATQSLSKKAPTPSPPKKAPIALPEPVKNPLGKVVGPANPAAVVKPANGSTAAVDSPDDSTDSEPEPATKSSPQKQPRKVTFASASPSNGTASTSTLVNRPSLAAVTSAKSLEPADSQFDELNSQLQSQAQTQRDPNEPPLFMPETQATQGACDSHCALLTIDEPANVFHASSSQPSAPDRGPPKGWPRPLDDAPSSEQDVVREIAKILPRSSPPPVEKRTTRSQSARISASPEPWGRQGRPAATNKPSPTRSASPATRKVLVPDSEGNVPAYEGTVGDGGRPTRFTNARGRINQVHGATLDQPRSSQPQPRPSQPQPSMLRSVATSIGNAMPSLLKSGPSSSQPISTGPPPPLSQPRSSFSAKLASRKSILDFDAERIARQQASERNDQARYSLPTLVASVPVPRPSQSAWARKAPVSGQDDDDSDDEAPGSQRLSRIFGAPASARA